MQQPEVHESQEQQQEGRREVAPETVTGNEPPATASEGSRKKAAPVTANGDLHPPATASGGGHHFSQTVLGTVTPATASGVETPATASGVALRGKRNPTPVYSFPPELEVQIRTAGFDVFYKLRGSRGGGVAIFVRRSAFLSSLLSLSFPERAEGIAVELSTVTSRQPLLRVASVYLLESDSPSLQIFLHLCPLQFTARLLISSSFLRGFILCRLLFFPPLEIILLSLSLQICQGLPL